MKRLIAVTNAKSVKVDRQKAKRFDRRSIAGEQNIWRVISAVAQKSGSQVKKSAARTERKACAMRR